MSYEIEIKPCPFCGSTNIKVDKCTSRVRCGNCFCTSGMIGKLVVDINDKDAAIKAWNTRVGEYGSKNDRR